MKCKFDTMSGHVPRNAPTTIMGILREKLFRLGHDEDGAALVITLAVFFLMYLGCMGVYAISMAVKERIHLQNAADAAAYSAAVVQADTLSRIATINRAMAWTYVQMTRRQMDYIVYKMLDRACAHYDSDRSEAQRFNRNYSVMACGGHKSPGGGWFIGSNGAVSSLFQMHINGLNSTLLSQLLPFLSQLSFIGHDLNLGGDDYADIVKAGILGAGADCLYDIMKSGDNAGKTGLSQLLYVEALKLLSDTAWTPRNLADADTFVSDAETWASVSRFLGELGKSDIGYSAGTGVLLNNLHAQILSDRLQIASMNLYVRRCAREMPARIENTVREILRSNIPGQMQASTVYYLSQNEHPLQNETSYFPAEIDGFANGYFCNLYNNATDEKRFLEFAGYNGSIVDVLKKGAWATSSLTAGGIDQWFVRGNGRARSEGGRGIQRCYKHWAEGPLASEHAAYNPYLPSCWNTEDLHGSPPSVALYAEWQWWSDAWCCPRTLFGRLHIPINTYWLVNMSRACRYAPGPSTDWLASVMAPIKALSHVGDIIDFLVKAPQGVKPDATSPAHQSVHAPVVGSALPDPSDPNVTYKPSPVDSYKDGCGYSLDVMGIVGRGLIPMVSYSRIYADDPHLYNQCYVGERAKPLILRMAYFGKAGTISVGIRKMNENPFARFIGTISGIFTAFDPDWNGAGQVTHTFVFSSAKAGYRDKGSSQSRSDYSQRAYRIDWNSSDQDWNLCQSDWDAVFVPVRMAYSQAISYGGVSTWVGGDDRMLEDWVQRDADKWNPVADAGNGDNMCRNVNAPRGMLLGNGHDGTLKWRELSHVMFH